MPPIHPGEHLRDELEWMRMPASRLATALGIPARRMRAILHGKQAITADTALRLARYFGSTAQFWMNLQNSYDLKIAEAELGNRLAAIEPVRKQEHV